MSELNEKHHAYLICLYYKLLSLQFGDRGLKVFIKATQIYGEQRGKRMALRALRDGEELTCSVYLSYSEWKASTPEWFDIKEEVCGNAVFATCSKCPWSDVFKENNLLDCGKIYCSEIDKAIVRGFNPYLEIVLNSLQYTDNCCKFSFKGSDVTGDIFHRIEKLNKKNGNRNIMPFDFHCAHVCQTFNETILNVFGENAICIIESVKKAFVEKYGNKVFGKIQSYENVNFNILYNAN